MELGRRPRSSWRDGWMLAACQRLLMAAGVAIFFMGSVAINAALASSTSSALRIPFATAGVGLVLAGVLAVVRRREALVTSLLTGITGASFAMALVEMSVRAPDASDRYNALWIPSVLAIALVAVRLVERGFRTEPEAAHPLDNHE